MISNGPGTGIGRMDAGSEAAETARIAEDYLARQKKGFPCGTHTLFRRRPSDITPMKGWR